MFPRAVFHPSGLRNLALAALFCVGCIGQPPESERRVVHEWASEPMDLMAKGEYEQAVRLLEAVPESRRDGIWYYAYVLSSRSCIRKHPNDARYKTSILDNLADGERLHPVDASIKLWYGVALKGVGSLDTAREKFGEARMLAKAAIRESPDQVVRYENRVVIENLDANGD